MLAYNSGRSEQVPTGRVVAVRGKRPRRRIGYDGIFLHFERWEPDPPERRSRKVSAPLFRHLPLPYARRFD